MTPRSGNESIDSNRKSRRIETEESECEGLNVGQLAPILDNLTEAGDELIVPINGRRFKIQLIED